MQTLKPASSLEGLGADSDKSLRTLAKGQKDFIKDDEHGSAFPGNADEAYIVLLNVFAYLSTKDLISAARVSKMWNLVASDDIFWRRVSLNKVSVNNSYMMLQHLKEHGVKSLDMRGARFFSLSGGDPFDWPSFCRTLAKVTTLDEVVLDIYSFEGMFLLGEAPPQLKSLSAYCAPPAFPYRVNINFLKNMKELETLKLVSREPMILNIRFGPPDDNIQLKLTKLIITRAVNLSCIENILPTTLVSLGLGDCDSLTTEFWRFGIHKLVNLTSLRLETCLQFDQTMMIAAEISKLPNLTELELIDFLISIRFLSVISKCKKLEFLLLKLSYKKTIEYPISDAIFQCLKNMKNSLKVFVLAVAYGIDLFNMDLTWILLCSKNRRSVHLHQVEFVKIAFIGVDGKVDYFSNADIQSRLRSYLEFEIVESYSCSLLDVSLENFK